ncbi:MAG: M42 family metallopeptidase [Candidatus Thorarchaeota archaeon]|jgi:endoglucanase
MADSKLDIKFLEEICNSFGPSGHEKEVQKIVRDYGQKYADEVLYDRMGSVIFRKGDKGPKIMLAGHVDEIGFVITKIEKKGFLRFHQLGGWWDQTLLTQEVVINPSRGDKKIMGIIGAPPPHVLKPEDRSKVVTKDRMFIDIGATSKKEVEELGIRVGDPVVPHSLFRTMKRIRKEKKNDDDKDAEEETREVTLAVAKAFDDRIGVFLAIEIMKRLAEEKIDHPNTVYSVSTVQEEIGLRGARTAAQMLLPDIGFALEVEIPGDVPGSESMLAKMGKGVAISAGDSSMIPNPALRNFVVDVAEEIGIPIQQSVLKAGGTDAGVIHITGMGVPSLVVGVPTRHIHSHHGMLDLSDVEQTVDLMVEVIKRLDEKTIAGFTSL